MLSRAFIEHATNGANWSLHKSIRAMFPEIEAMGFKIRDEVTSLIPDLESAEGYRPLDKHAKRI